jgi:hypothetical protein
MIERKDIFLTPARRSSLETKRAQRYWPQTGLRLQATPLQAHTDNCRLAQGVEVSQNEKKQTCLLSFHSCLPSMPAASSAGSPLPGPLERPHSESGGRSSLERIYRINEMFGLCVSRNSNPDYRAYPVGCFLTPVQPGYPELCCSL